LAVASAAGPFPFVGEGTTDPSIAVCEVAFNGLALSNKQHSADIIQLFFTVSNNLART